MTSQFYLWPPFLLKPSTTIPMSMTLPISLTHTSHSNSRATAASSTRHTILLHLDISLYLEFQILSASHSKGLFSFYHFFFFLGGGVCSLKTIWDLSFPTRYWISAPCIGASLVAQTIKNLPTMQETRVSSLGQGRSTGEGNGYPTVVVLPGEFQEQRSLPGYSP